MATCPQRRSKDKGNRVNTLRVGDTGPWEGDRALGGHQWKAGHLHKEPGL